MWVQSVGGEHTLEKETATRSRILAWEIRGVWQASPRGHKESDMTEHTAQAHRVLGKEKLELGPYHYVDVNTLSFFFFFFLLECISISFSGNLPDPGIKPRSPELQADTLLSEPPGHHP